MPAEALVELEAEELPIKDAEKLAGIPAEYLPEVWREAQQWGVDHAVNRYNIQRERDAQRAKTEKESRRAVEREGLTLVTDQAPITGNLFDYELDHDDEVAAAREAGTLSGYIDPENGELYYLDLTREVEPAASTPSVREIHRDYEAERKAKEKARRDGVKARRTFAPALINRKLKAPELVDELATLVVRLANHETTRLAAKLAGYEGDGYAWVAELLAGTAAQRERGARAIGVARADLLVHSEWGSWGDEHLAYLAQLADLGYEQTDYDYDRDKLTEAEKKGQAR